MWEENKQASEPCLIEQIRFANNTIGTIGRHLSHFSLTWNTCLLLSLTSQTDKIDFT
jgi:hypothetical protein